MASSRALMVWNLHSDATFGFKLPVNPVGEGKICITVVVDIIPSPTGLAGNLNPKVASPC